MLCVLPPVMILLGLMDEWIHKDILSNIWGDGSKLLILYHLYLHSYNRPIYTVYCSLLKKS